VLAAMLGRFRGLGEIHESDGLSIASPLEGHVVILGYGLGGELLAGALRASGQSYTVVDLNVARIQAARKRGEPAVYGDVTQREILERVAVGKAREIVLMLNDPDATERAVRAVRHIVPGAPITARARYVADVAVLEQAGATSVIAQEFEASIEIVSRVLQSASLSAAEADRHILDALRRRRLPTPHLSHSGAALDSLPVLTGLGIEAFLVRESSWVAGRSVAGTELRRHAGATLVAVSRSAGTVVHPAPTDVLHAGDLLYVVGGARETIAALEILERGPNATE
jgi:CPA2 family monovalent cation:H+ antiporter-2